MEGSRPNVFVININPENWQKCLKGHRFGIPVRARRPEFDKGDIFLVRRTGKDCGVMGIWVLKEEECVTTHDEVPDKDSYYGWLQWFDPIVDFETPVSEEFVGKTRFSTKIQIAAARLIGSVPIIHEPELARYLETILKEKAKECSARVAYQGRTRTIADVLQEIVVGLTNH